LFYGYAAARNRTARTVLMPLLDVLQSVPILSFLPIVLLSLSAILPQAFAAARCDGSQERVKNGSAEVCRWELEDAWRLG